VKPFFLEGDSSSRNEGDGGEPQGEGVLRLIVKGKIEEDSVRPVIIITGKEELLHFGEGNL
jgi:hypothetical protein